LGVSSSGFLSNVIAGRKNLSPTQIRRLAEILELPEPDTLYFEAMVQYGQGRDADEKAQWFERMSQLQSIRIRILEPRHLSLFSRPELVFLYELLTFVDFDGDHAKLGERFDPPLSPAKVAQAFLDLERLGLVERDGRGRLRVLDSAVTSGQEVRSEDLAAFHRRTMAMARRALAKTPAQERDLSVLTLGLSPDGFRRIKTEIAHLRRKLVSIALEENEPERIYQLNFHVLPVTRRLEHAG
jgi:uncharacterized protein (TIGR02147 family)